MAGTTRVKDLSEAQLLAIDLLISKDYNNLTDIQIAEKVGISEATLYNWKKKPEFNNELVRQAKELNRSTITQVYSYIRQTLANPHAKEGTKVKIAELVLKSNGEFKETVDQNVTVKTDKPLNEVFEELGI